MMMLSTPLVPKNPDGVLRVIILGRISTAKQDPASIASQHHDVERWLHSVYDGPVEIVRIGEQASGWLAGLIATVRFFSGK